MPDPIEKCVARPGYGYPSVLCDRPAKGTLKDGTAACGIHLAAERRVKENGDKREDEYQEQRLRRDALMDLCDALGIARRVPWDARYINLDAREAKALLTRLNSQKETK